MTDAKIVPSERVDQFIKKCLSRLTRQDAERIRRQLVRAELDSNIQHDLFNELVVGAYLAFLGFSPRYEVRHERLTPDWSLFGADSELVAIVEVATLHIDSETAIHIARQRATGTNPWYHLEDLFPRLYESMGKKAAKYKKLASSIDKPLVVSNVLSFELEMADELDECLFGADLTLFEAYPELSGILLTQVRSGSYPFQYVQNPNGARPFRLAASTFAG